MALLSSATQGTVKMDGCRSTGLGGTVAGRATTSGLGEGGVATSGSHLSQPNSLALCLHFTLSCANDCE